MIESTASRRVRAFGYFVIAGVYFFLAQMVASHAANGFAAGDSYELVERVFLLFLLLVGYTAMGRVFQHQRRPIEAMGLVFRSGWLREIGLGAALGWGMLIASILPLVLIRGLIVTVWGAPHQFVILGLDILLLAVSALGEEIVFRGYPFQRLIEVMGPFLATMLLSVLFGVAHALNPASSRFSIMVTVFAGWLLAAAYLRTQALWLSWGWHFAWNASMGLIFGLPVSGITRFSPVIQSNTIGPVWITGGNYGPEASVVTAIVMLMGLIVLFRITRDYAGRYVQPAIIASAREISVETAPEADPETPVYFDATGPLLVPHDAATTDSAEATVAPHSDIVTPVISPHFLEYPANGKPKAGDDPAEDSPIPPDGRSAG